jgi:D-alanine-D-alanine ligase
MKTVGLTYDLKTDYQFKEGDPEDANAEFDHPSTVDVIANSIASLGYTVKKIGNVNNLLDNIHNLGVDIVFNISEGLFGRNRESQVPILLEVANIPFVGADGLTLGLTLDKILTKKILLYEGIPTPKFFEAKEARDVIDTDHMRFPLIVKPRFEGSSKGLSEKSKVDNIKELKEQVDYIINTYRQPALIEEFISGQEFTVALIGNNPVEAMPPVQVRIDGELNLGDLFYTFNRISSDRAGYVCPAQIDDKLNKKLMDLAVRTYKAVECCDFGRVDFRVDKKGNPFVLEINPLPSLSTEDVFMFIAKYLGISYDDIIAKIINAALQRHKLS